MLVKTASSPANSSRKLQQRLFSLLEGRDAVAKLTQIHSQVLVNGFSQKNFILVKLLSAYIAAGRLLSAKRVFEGARNPSTTLWNLMIRGYSRSETPEECVVLLRKMVAEPNGYSFASVISGCARSGLFREGEQVHGRVLGSGYGCNVFVQTSLVNLYASAGGGGGMGSARKVFDDMSERSLVSWNSLLAGYMRCGDVEGASRVFGGMSERSVVSWTSMIAGCSKNGRCREALHLFGKMRGERVWLDHGVLVVVLSACAELGDLVLGRQIHSYVEKTFGNVVVLNNALIHMYASCGAIEEAYAVFRWMPQRSNVSWNSIITAFAKQGYAQEALVLFEWMQSLGAEDGKPDEVTLLSVLSACSHAGLVHEGRQIFENMVATWGVTPRIEHYGCIVDLLSRAGLLDEAENLINTMPMKPNDAIWATLLSGCRTHKSEEVAFRVAKKLVDELVPDKAGGYLVLLAHVYMTADRWCDVADLRKVILEMGSRKRAGRSWIQTNGAVHDFVAGDRAHKHSSLLYEMLDTLTWQAKQKGVCQLF